MRKILGLILCISAFTSWSQKPTLKKAQFQDTRLNQSWVIVKVIPGTSVGIGNADIRVLHRYNSSEKSVLDGLCKIKLSKGQDPIDFCNELLRQQNVIYAEPIIQDYPLYVPSDPRVSDQTYLDRINAFDAWEVTRGDDDITIGIIDTGISLDHEDLATNLWINTDDPIDGVDNDENGYIDDYYGYDFADDDNDPSADKSTHGAGVAGVASAVTDNGIGISGIGFNTKIAALKGFNSSNNFSGGLFEAIIYGVDNGMEVLNLSWGSVRAPLQSEQDIIDYAVLENNVVVIAAAGNDGGKTNPEAKFYPASYDHVLSVAASDIDDNRWSESTYNHSVDIIAPGSSVFSTLGNNTYGTNLGTSFSAPMVAGTAALLKDQFPSLNARQVMERLRVSADDIYDIGSNSVYDGKLGKGRLNAFRAVAETGLKSLRMEHVSLTTSISNQLFFGDTINIKGTIVNYLNKVNSPLFTLSSNDNLALLTRNISPGLMESMQEKEFQFQFIIPEETPPNSEINIRVDMMEASYNDFQFIEFTTAPNYIDFGNENASMTISGDGNLAFTDDSFSEGIGFQSQFGQVMKHAGFFVGISANSFSDNLIKDYGTGINSNDFITKKNYKLAHHPSADLFGYSEFEDTIRNVIVEQSNLAWANEDFIILRYRIVNNSLTPLTNLISGVYSDWNLDDQTKNQAIYNTEKQYNLTSNEGKNQFTATQVIGNGTSLFSNLDIGTSEGNEADLTNEFTDEMLYGFLTTNQIDSAGKEGLGNDVASLSAISFDQVDINSSEYVNVILAVGSSVNDLENTLATAKEKLAHFEQNPLVQETFKICDLNQISIDPNKGTSYEFYEDVKGQNLLFIGEVFEPNDISSDTIFYVRNIDGEYPSDFYQIKLELFSEISDFEISTDTLYLDNNTNVVSFISTSLDAVAWRWDFGQGTIASIEHPTISFTDEGVYEISLTVINSIGCEDTRVKNLVVVNRPSAPSFDDLLICPNESITITDSNAEKLRVYSSIDSNEILISGNSVEIGPFFSDTIIYVSGVFDGFESARSVIQISVHYVTVDFEILQDTISVDFRLQLNALTNNEATLRWFVDEVDFGSEPTIFVGAENGYFSVQLQIESLEGCILTETKTIQVSTSPIPIQNDVAKCDGQPITIQPENGTYFGFYSDDSLTDLIKKGTQLEVSDKEKIYVVGLDDGLPSQPIEVNISTIAFYASIEHSIELVANKKKVSLSVSSENDISQYEWFLNDEHIEVASNPSIFLENEIYEIVLKATSEEGCLSLDTLSLDFEEVILSIDPIEDIHIFPNPTNDYLNIFTSNEVEFISIHSVSGQQLYKKNHPNKQLDIRFLKSGLYILRSIIEGKTVETIFIKN